MMKYLILCVIASLTGYSNAVNVDSGVNKDQTSITKKRKLIIIHSKEDRKKVQELSKYVDVFDVKEGHVQDILNIINANPDDAIMLKDLHERMYGRGGLNDIICGKCRIGRVGHKGMEVDAKVQLKVLRSECDEIFDRLGIRQYLNH